MNKSERKSPNGLKEAEDLAAEIMELSRSTLLVGLRFLEPALYKLSMVPNPETTLATDGFSLQYGFLHILKSYQIQKELVTRDLLHMILHCLYHHPFVDSKIDSVCWDLACDIAVEATITELAIPQTRVKKASMQEETLSWLSANLRVLTAEGIYHFLKKEDIPFETLLTMRELFLADDHVLWYEHSSSSEDTEEREKSGEDSSGSDGSADASNRDSEEEQEEGSAAPLNSGGNEDQGSAEQQMLLQFTGDSKEETEEEWKDISDQIKTDLETFSQKYGQKSATLLETLRILQKEEFDYRKFLQLFAVLGEESHLNPDEFDYLYYTYGLKLYGNVPLVEPLEYRDAKKIREFVIAVDTSASVKGELVSKFLENTYRILKQEENFFEDILLYIIQCDSEIKEAVCIHSEEEMEEYVSDFKCKGFGGTDFRPVFEYVDELLEKQKLTELKGLLYFTDGEGEFPVSVPAYETAFIFIGKDSLQNSRQLESYDPETVRVPAWAMKVVIHEEDLDIAGQNISF